MINIYPYATKLLNIGKFGYIHRITTALVQIAETQPLLHDDNYAVRVGAEELIDHLYAVIEREETDAESRWNDWASD